MIYVSEEESSCSLRYKVKDKLTLGSRETAMSISQKRNNNGRHLECNSRSGRHQVILVFECISDRIR